MCCVCSACVVCAQYVLCVFTMCCVCWFCLAYVDYASCVFSMSSVCSWVLAVVGVQVGGRSGAFTKGSSCAFNMCDMIHSHVWHDPFICVTWVMHRCDVISSHVWYDSFICVTLCDLTRRTYRWVTSHIWMSHVTRRVYLRQCFVRRALTVRSLCLARDNVLWGGYD